jgi:DNA recombination protein RmuC
MSIVLALLAGLVGGALAVWLAVRGALAERRDLAAVAHERELHLAEVTTRLETVEAGMDERLTSAIKELSAQALRENSAAFAEQAMGQLGQFVKPLKESIDKVETNAQALGRASQQAFGAVRQELETVRTGQERLRTETGNLVTALRAPHVRGRWGEVGLRNVVEAAGLLEHCDFVVQASTRDSDGALLRPDLVVRLPGGKHIVVDSKVALDAYLDALDAQDAAIRAEALARHARQVRDHMQKLAAKAYWKQFDPSPDFVVMALPDETFLSAAHEHDRALNEDAWASGVVLASPTILFGVLRTVGATWQQEALAEGAREVSELGRELYKRVVTWTAHVGRMGKLLDGTVKAYNESVGSLERQVLPQARRFKEHGITGVEIPELAPVERQTRALAAPDLLDDGDSPALEVLPGDAHAA